MFPLPRTLHSPFSKFISVLDLKVNNNSFDYRYKLLPIISNQIKPSHDMESFIKKIKQPYNKLLSKVIGKSNLDLYRRGTFNGSFDQLICESMINVLDAEISLSPGFRWGPTILANEDITMSDIYSHTAITYRECYWT